VDYKTTALFSTLPMLIALFLPLGVPFLESDDHHDYYHTSKHKFGYKLHSVTHEAHYYGMRKHAKPRKLTPPPNKYFVSCLTADG